MANICELLRKKIPAPRYIMAEALQRYDVGTPFRTKDLSSVKNIATTGRIYVWLTELAQAGALDTQQNPKNKGAYLFFVTEEGKRCYECYLNSASSYYANHVVDEDTLGSCILRTV